MTNSAGSDQATEEVSPEPPLLARRGFLSPALFRLDLLLPCLVLAIGLLATHQLWQDAHRQQRIELQNQFDAALREAELKIEQRISNYRNVLRGLQSLHRVSNPMGRTEFAAYVEGLKLDEHHRGIQSLGFSTLVPGEQLEQHIASIRKQGFPDYTIKPEGSRSLYAPVVYVEPFQGNNLRVFGLDNYATAERRATLERARDSEQASISGKLTLVQDDNSTQAGILMFLPVYRQGAAHDTPETRLDNIVGWVSAAFRMEDLMSVLLGDHARHFGIAIHDGTETSPDTLLYDSDTQAHDSPLGRNTRQTPAEFRHVGQIQVADRLWTLSFASLPAFDTQLDAHRPQLIAATGGATSLILALCAWLLLRGRLRALQDAQRLEHARRQAESASEAKGEFIANISHELRTPINSILGIGHLALRRESDPRKREQLERIQLSGEHLLGIVNNILDFANMESGTLQLHPVDFTLREVLTDIKHIAAPKAADKGLELVFDVAPDLQLRKLYGDARRLEQVMLNYLDNAIKFTAEGRVTVRVLRREEDDASCRLRIEVQDTGIGIAPEALPHLFTPFWQADGSSTRRHQGTGLGLAICKRLADSITDGEIGVDSTPGQGSTFWFGLRLDKAYAARPDLSPSAAATGPLAPDLFSRISGARILVAEDHALSQTILGELLTSAGASVQVAWNGEEALESLRQQPCDCVLMDVQMPEMDGVEATRAIRSDPAWATLPIIAVTAHASEENRRRCLEAGMNDFLGKPFTPESLYATLARWLPERPAEAPTVSPAPTQAATAQAMPPSAPPLAPSLSPGAGETGLGEAEVIDLSILSGLIGGDRAKMRDFVDKFLNLARGDMAHIESALERNDLETLNRLAHHNKAPARMVGALGFAKLCQDLMDRSKQADTQENIQATVLQMRPLLDRIEQRIQTELA